MMPAVVDLVAVVAVLLAALGWRRTGHLKKEVERAAEEASSVRRHVNASHRELMQEIESLRHSLQKRTGNDRFTADMPVAEVLELHPDAGAVMASFHLGGCSSCDITEQHLLGPAAASYGVDIDALLNALNNLLVGGAIPEQQPRGDGLLDIEPGV